MNVEIGTEEALIFRYWEYLFQIFGILSLQCEPDLSTQQYVLDSSNHWVIQNWSSLKL